MKSLCLWMLLLAGAAVAPGCSKGHFTASLKSLKMKRVYLGIDPKFKQIVARLDFELSDDPESCAIARDELRADIDDLPLVVTGNGGPAGEDWIGRPDGCAQFYFGAKWPLGTVAGWPNGELLYKPPGINSTLTIRDDSQTISMRMLDLFRAPPQNVVSIVSPSDGVVRSGDAITVSLSEDAVERLREVDVVFDDPSTDSPFNDSIKTSLGEGGQMKLIAPTLTPGSYEMLFFSYFGPLVLSCENAERCGVNGYFPRIGTIPIEVAP